MWTHETMLSDAAGWLDASGPESDVVLSTRVRLARNLAGEKFPCCSSDEEANSVRERALAAISKSNYMTNALVLRMEDVDPLTRLVLVERHLVSAAFAEDGAGRAAVAVEGELVSAMVNEEDHLRLQCIRSGLTPVDAWRLVGRIDSELERNLHYAFCSDWGYSDSLSHQCGDGDARLGARSSRGAVEDRQDLSGAQERQQARAVVSEVSTARGARRRAASSRSRTRRPSASRKRTSRTRSSG